jgi:hypothetical protein
VPAPIPRWPVPKHRRLNDKYHSPRIYSWVEFGARDTPNLIPRNSNLILYAISIRFVIITVSATVQISDFRFQNWPIFRAAEAPPGARGRDDQWLFTGICAWADTAFRPRPTMIFIIDKIYPHSHPLQISDFRFQISDFEWPIFRAAEAPPGPLSWRACPERRRGKRGKRGLGGKGGEVQENNEKLTIDNTESTIFRAAELYYPRIP